MTKYIVATAIALTAMGFLFADGEETLREFGRADTSAQNDFWTPGEYRGVKVFRAVSSAGLIECASRMTISSAVDPVDTRFRTSAESQPGNVKTTPAGMFIGFR